MENGDWGAPADPPAAAAPEELLSLPDPRAEAIKTLCELVAARSEALRRKQRALDTYYKHRKLQTEIQLDLFERFKARLPNRLEWGFNGMFDDERAIFDRADQAREDARASEMLEFAELHCKVLRDQIWETFDAVVAMPEPLNPTKPIPDDVWRCVLQ